MKKHSILTKAIISSCKSIGLIYVYDSLLNLHLVFSSLTKLAKVVHSNNNTLTNCLKHNKLFRGNWFIKDSLLNKKDVPSIFDMYSKEYE